MTKVVVTLLVLLLIAGALWTFAAGFVLVLPVAAGIWYLLNQREIRRQYEDESSGS